MSNPQNQPIPFYKEGEQWGQFSNYYLVAIKVQIPVLLNANGEVVPEKGYLPIGELEFSNSEALFHALKFTQEGNVKPNLIKQVSKMGAGESKKFTKGYDKVDYKTESWWYNGWGKPGYNVRAMKWVVREKFSQNLPLKKILLDTGEVPLVEDSGGNDKFWGNGEKGNGINCPLDENKGKNWLGKILMEIRTELAANQGPTSNSNPPPKKQPTDSSQPATPDNSNSNPSDQTNNENDNNQSPKPNQPEENENYSPTDNNGSTPSPADNDNSDKESNGNSPSQNSDNPEPLEPTTDTPPINIDEINKTETPEKAQQVAQQQIQQLFVKSKVKPSELDKSLWKNKNSWEEYLKELKTSQEIADFAQLLERKIKEKQQEKAIKGRNNANSSNKSNPSNKALILVSGGTLLVIFIIIFIIKIRLKKRKK